MITLTSVEMNTWIAALLWPLDAHPRPDRRRPAVRQHQRAGAGQGRARRAAGADHRAGHSGRCPRPTRSRWPGLLILRAGTADRPGDGLRHAHRVRRHRDGRRSGQPDHGPGLCQLLRPACRAGRSSAVSQFLALVATMAFLAVNAPPGAARSAGRKLLHAADFGHADVGRRAATSWRAGARTIFSAGLQLSLPIVAALLITNIALGILTRAAPQLNIFGIGFPISLGVGLLVISLVAALPGRADPEPVQPGHRSEPVDTARGGANGRRRRRLPAPAIASINWGVKIGVRPPFSRNILSAPSGSHHLANDHQLVRPAVCRTPASGETQRAQDIARTFEE